MPRRPRRRRVKRSAKGHDRQQRQRLSKEIRERYPPGAADDPDADWHAGLDAQLDEIPRRGGRKSRALPSPPETTATASDEHQGARTAVDRGDDRSELEGRIVAVSSGACRVESAGQGYDCILPSDLARDQRATIAVGDRVLFGTHGTDAFRVDRVLERRTTLSRPDPHNPRRQRVIAANIDVAVHVASVVDPPLRPALIDRYLIAIDRGGAEALICVNKVDLLTNDEARRRELERLAPYRHLALEILPVSAVTGEGIDRLRRLLAGKTAVFAGHSGVGKSSLLNALSPEVDAVTAATGRGGKGRHTTTRSILYRLGDDIRIIDTPGIRELGLWELTTDQLRGYFPDFEAHARACRFNNCSHSHEPECAVRDALDTGELERARYATYRRILASLEA